MKVLYHLQTVWTWLRHLSICFHFVLQRTLSHWTFQSSESSLRVIYLVQCQLLYITEIGTSSCFWSSSSQSVHPRPAASPENLLEMQIPEHHPRPADSGAQGVGPANWFPRAPGEMPSLVGELLLQTRAIVLSLGCTLGSPEKGCF